MSRRTHPFPQGTAERVLFDRWRRANGDADRHEATARMEAAEAAAHRAKADSYADALRALGHGDKIPGQIALPAPAKRPAPPVERSR